MVLLGDGEFDGTGLQQTVQDAGWSSVCRTGTHRTAWWDGETFRLDTLGGCSKPGTLIESVTSGKAGGLEKVEPLKAVKAWEPLKAVGL